MLHWISKITIAATIAFIALAAGPVQAATNVGPKKCQECHRAEYGVWEGTEHFKSLRGAHKAEGAKEIAAASGGNKSMRRNDTCATCHYTKVGKKAEAGPSCESCHGSASEWLQVHNDLGGAKPGEETADHKAKRLAAAQKVGMIHSSMLYDIAENCNGCHTMQNIPPELAGTLIDAGHKINGDYELVRYSQGQVRHRFYPPDVTNNKAMSKAEMSTMFLTGHAVGLVFGSTGLSKSSNAKYKAAMQKRVDSAAAAIGAVKGQVPEAGALLSSPSEANARKFVAAIQGKDLSGAVGGMLPSDFK